MSCRARTGIKEMWRTKLVTITIIACSSIGIFFNHESPYMVITVIIITILFLTTFTCSVTAPVIILRNNESVQMAEEYEARRTELQRHSAQIWTTDVPPPSYSSLIPPSTPPPTYCSIIGVQPPPYDESPKPDASINNELPIINPIQNSITINMPVRNTNTYLELQVP